MAKDDIGGVWRTIGGRRVFIKNGQDLASAMKESGKFNNAKSNNDEHKNTISNRDAKDVLKALNDEGSDFTFDDDVKIEDGKIKTSVGVSMPDERGYVERELEIPLSKNETKETLENKLRDWQDRHSSPDTFEEEDFPRLKDQHDFTKPTQAQEIERQRLISELRSQTSNEDYLKFIEKTTKEQVSNEDIKAKISEVTKGLKEQNKYDNMSNYEIYDKADALARETKDYELKDKINKKLDSIDRANRKGEGYADKQTNELRDILKEQIKENNSWQEQIKQNNASMEKDVTDLQNQINDYRNKSYQSDDALKRYQYWQEAEKLQNQYYERFRENERANAKIKVESPNEKYMNVDAYAGYKDKFDKTWGKDGSNDKVVSAKMYTNDEFMEHLEDSNWHSERRQLLEANLTNQELKYIKDKTKVSAWGVENLTGKEQVDKLIKEAKNQNNKISNTLRQKAYQKYLKEHPNSKMTFENFKDMNSK